MNVLRPSMRFQSLVGGSVGHFVEWYDWFVYAACAVYFAPIFFPHADATAQLLQAAAVFAAGFLFRPVGAWLIGVYGDRHGRRAALALSVTLMGAGSLIIALAPGYATIGLASPALLLLARIIQGISVGGESGVNAAYVVEVASPERRGLWGSFASVNLSLGQLAALLVLILLQHILPPATLEGGGWRIAFGVGSLLALIAFWLRIGIAESAAFERIEDCPEPTPIRSLWGHRRACLLVFGLTAGAAPLFYSFTSYLQKFLVNSGGFTKQEATRVAAEALLCFILLQPIGGWLSDRVGRKPLLLAFGVLATAGTYPLFETLRHVRSANEALLTACAAMVVISCYTAISTIVKAELFPVRIRATGAALPFALAQSIVSGTVEYVALWLKQQNVESLFFVYVNLWGLVFLIVAIFTPETRPRKNASSHEPRPEPFHARGAGI